MAVAVLSRYSFARAVRLLETAEFRAVFRSPIKSIDANLVVLAQCNQIESARLGLAVAKKNIRRAVDRNRIKRLVRESFRLNQHVLIGMDMIVVARAGARTTSNRDILSALNIHWKRLAEKCKNSSSC